MTEPASYSQWAEDRLIWEYFGRKDEGFFVEVGANDPQNLSQTWLLEQKGWRGILVEPQSACCERLRRVRQHSQVFQVACSSPERRGTAPFHISSSDDLSSLELHVNDTAVVYTGTEMVRVLPLDEVLAEAGNPRIDFLSIDVEGTELDVLKGFDLERHCPALLLVEDHLHHLAVHRHLARHGYKLVKRTGSNNWYVPVKRSFPLASGWEKAKLFRKVWLGTPVRAVQLALKKKRRGASTKQ